ncbi:MAG: TIGR03790 family protein, partial [Phycisphaerales bacterium]|nr:TIGR03790 family protein [Phycisphaerales bacterium]
MRHALVILACCSSALADGTGANALILVDPMNADSMYAANVYAAARDIPASNILHLDPAAANWDAFLVAHPAAVEGTIENRRIGDHIDFIVVMPGAPYSITTPSGIVEDRCTTLSQFAVGSLYTMLGVRDDIETGTLSVDAHLGYSTNDFDPVAIDGAARWLDGAVSTAPDARQVFVGAMLGYTGERGNTIDEVIDLIHRSVASDGTRPDGTFYFMNNEGDAARNVRAVEFPDAIAALATLGRTGEQIDAIMPLGRDDCLGIMTGSANPDIDNPTYTLIPGAFADHLTSYAGRFNTDSQVKMSRWIANGASGSLGAVQEPCNYRGKFPRPKVHASYASGLTLGEAVVRAGTFIPFQMLLYGDPLTRAFTHIPDVEVPDFPVAPATGVVQFSPQATTTHPTASIESFDLLVDGVLVESITSGPFTLDTATLGDGHHEVQVVARDDSPVEAAGRFVSSITVDNMSRSVTLTPSITQGDLDDVVSLNVVATGPIDHVEILQGARVVASVDGASGAVPVSAHLLGAGPVVLRARAVGVDGRASWSAPATIDLDPARVGGGSSAPIAFDYERTVLDNRPFVLELPATYLDDLGEATYT